MIVQSPAVLRLQLMNVLSLLTGITAQLHHLAHNVEAPVVAINLFGFRPQQALQLLLLIINPRIEILRYIYTKTALTIVAACRT